MIYRYTIINIYELDEGLIRINEKWNYDIGENKDFMKLLNINFVSKSCDFSIAITNFLDNFFDKSNKKFILKCQNDILSIYDYDKNYKISELNQDNLDVNLNGAVIACSNLEELEKFLHKDKNQLSEICEIIIPFLLKGKNPCLPKNKTIPFNGNFLETINNMLKQRSDKNVYIKITDYENYETRIKGECIYFKVVNKTLNKEIYYYFTPGFHPISLSHTIEL